MPTSSLTDAHFQLDQIRTALEMPLAVVFELSEFSMAPDKYRRHTSSRRQAASEVISRTQAQLPTLLTVRWFESPEAAVMTQRTVAINPAIIPFALAAEFLVVDDS